MPGPRWQHLWYEVTEKGVKRPSGADRTHQPYRPRVLRSRVLAFSRSRSFAQRAQLERSRLAQSSNGSVM
jgi:hypothetical protein